MEMSDLFLKLSKVHIWRHFIPHVDRFLRRLMECNVMHLRSDMMYLKVNILFHGFHSCPNLGGKGSFPQSFQIH